LLWHGIRESQKSPDENHQLGYGRGAFFWSLVSALGMFWLGGGLSLYHGISTIIHPPTTIDLTWHNWAVLGTSFLVDGYVLTRTLRELQTTKPDSMSLFQYLQYIKNPLMMSVILEDFTATIGKRAAFSLFSSCSPACLSFSFPPLACVFRSAFILGMLQVC
jgi:zinc transporter 9